jgi:hypothetical protein
MDHGMACMGWMDGCLLRLCMHASACVRTHARTHPHAYTSAEGRQAGARAQNVCVWAGANGFARPFHVREGGRCHLSQPFPLPAAAAAKHSEEPRSYLYL